MCKSYSAFLFVLAVTFLSSCRDAASSPAVLGKEMAAPSTGASSVWIVEKEGKKMFLAGTIHLLRQSDYPLPAPFELAYQQAEKVVFELPPGSDEDTSTFVKMQALGSYAEGDSIANHIQPETLLKLQKWAERNRQPVAFFSTMKPWLLALTVAAVEYQSIGAEASNGVDQYFENKAKKDGKPGEGLETVEFQLGIFAGLSPQLQEELLLQTFSEAENIREDFSELLSAWRTGDTATLQEFLFRDAEKYPELMDAFLTRRNKAWIAPLMKNLSGEETAMVLVGAGHMGGKDGLIQLLKDQGCTVTQLMP